MSDSRIGRHKRQISDLPATLPKRTKHTTNAHPGLDSLPEEVLLVILDVLLASLVRCSVLSDVLDRVKALHSLCLTNRKLNRLATPYLSTFISNRDRRKVPQALDAMILDSKKAEGIKYVSWALDVKRSSQAMCRRSPGAESIYLQKLGRLGIPELAGALRQCFHGNSPEYHLATALVLAPNLEYLEAADVNYEQDTVEGVVWKPTWLELLALKALSSPPGLSQHFQSLHHLRLSMKELSFRQICPLLRLPAVRTLHFIGGYHDYDISNNAWDEQVGKKCSTVQTLIFESCVVTAEIIVQVLNAIRDLKTLRLESDSWCSRREDDNDYVAKSLSLSVLCKAIAEHKEMERLYIIEKISGHWEGMAEERLTATGEDGLEFLRDMQKLRYLDTDLKLVHVFFRVLIATTLSSLEHLVLQVTTEDATEEYIEGALEDLAVNYKSRLPALRDVLVWIPQWLPRLYLSRCKAAFESQGVDFVALSLEPKQGIWQLHPSTVKESSALGSGSWGCQLHSVLADPLHIEDRVPVMFHGPCGMYHDPNGRSIIDFSGRL